MIGKHALAQEIAEAVGASTQQIKKIFDELEAIAKDELQKGEDFTVPGIARISYGYTTPRAKGEMHKKGETYVGFGGVEQVAEADSKARKAKVTLKARPMPALTAHVPKANDAKGQAAFLSSKPGRAIKARKAK